jgi:hypothetical protein
VHDIFSTHNFTQYCDHISRVREPKLEPVNQPAVTRLRGASIVQILWSRLQEHPLSRLGPGLIAGVADDDPSGIATYSQAGAQYGLDMLWTMPVAFLLHAAIQSMCARIGRVTDKGLAANIKDAPSISITRVRALSLS